MYAMGRSFAKASSPRTAKAPVVAQPIDSPGSGRLLPIVGAFPEVACMFRSRMAEATLVGCLAALAGFCAIQAHGGEAYSVVAQSSRSSAATGQRPLAERIASANLPIIVKTAANVPTGTFAADSTENMAVAAVPASPATSPKASRTAAVPQRPARDGRRQTTARSSGKAPSSSSPGSVTR